MHKTCHRATTCKDDVIHETERIATPPEDRAAALGNMRKNLVKFGCEVSCSVAAWECTKQPRFQLTLLDDEDRQVSWCPSPVWGHGAKKHAEHFLKYDVQICRFWCIMTATKSLVLANE